MALKTGIVGLPNVGKVCAEQACLIADANSTLAK